MAESGTARRAPTGASVQRAQVMVWVLHLALPLLGLWLLIARPAFDVRWEHHLAHFVLVVAAAGINVVLGVRIARAARGRDDARLLLVALVMLVSAGFLGLHALATPGIILPGPSRGFALATPVGLLIASALAVASSVELSPARAAAVVRARGPLLWASAALLLAWGAVSLLNLPPLDAPLAAEQATGPLAALAVVGVGLYALAAWRYWRLYQRRPAVMLVAVITTFALLAEAMIAVAVGRNWHASWWEWHLLMLLAFGFVAYSAHVTARREGTAATLFHGIALTQTLQEIQEEYGAALEDLVTALRRRSEAGEEGDAPLAWEVARRFGLTEGQREVLERAGGALAAERDQIVRLGALVEVGKQSRVILSEDELLREAITVVAGAFPRYALRVGLLREGALEFPAQLAHGEPAGTSATDRVVTEALESLSPVEGRDDGTSVLVLPLVVKQRAAGLLDVRRAGGGFARRDRAVLESLASQLSIALENARLYAQLDTLFRRYLNPEVVTTLLSDPSQAALGGAIVEVTVLFADLRGFTSFSERSAPEDVVAMLNRYFGLAVPQILERGGTVMKFVGDAVMAVFNAPVRQPDHAVRAARAALAMQAAIDRAASERPDWPRFRVGVNTGPALVGNIGSEEIRDYTVIGDTVNLAARLEAAAEPGQVVIGGATAAALDGIAELRSLGRIHVKGKQEPVEAFVLSGLRG